MWLQTQTSNFFQMLTTFPRKVLFLWVYGEQLSSFLWARSKSWAHNSNCWSRNTVFVYAKIFRGSFEQDIHAALLWMIVEFKILFYKLALEDNKITTEHSHLAILQKLSNKYCRQKFTTSFVQITQKWGNTNFYCSWFSISQMFTTSETWLLLKFSKSACTLWNFFYRSSFTCFTTFHSNIKGMMTKNRSPSVIRTACYILLFSSASHCR